ncbi:MAG: glycosyltransferase family 2 protein [Flavobacterium sp.]|nr:MAG: glycosyltransferase family 2 protein [Flavobacterium sp.]
MISIITPHYNRSHLIRETIKSVISQEYEAWELIIVDDNSDENELKQLQDIVKIDNRIVLIENESTTRGPSVCRNKGVRYAKGEYIIFLDSDDLLKSHCLTQRVDAMRVNPELSMAVFLIENFSKQPGDLGSLFNVEIEDEKLLDAFLENNNPWQTMAPIWKTRFLVELKGFDEELFFMEDPELHIRALHHNSDNIKLFYNFPSDCYYRIHNNDETKKAFYYNSIFYRILFFKKIIKLYHGTDFYDRHGRSIKNGILNLLNKFLYSRLNEFSSMFEDYLLLIKQSNLFSNIEIKRIGFLTRLGSNTHPLLSSLKVKGLCYKLLPKSE